MSAVRLIPCRSKTEHGRKGCDGQPALFRNGEPQTGSRYVRTVRCARCRRTTFLSAADWANLPGLAAADFKRLAKEHKAPSLADLPTQDLEGAGFTRAQAADLFDAGFRGSDELAALERSE